MVFLFSIVIILMKPILGGKREKMCFMRTLMATLQKSFVLSFCLAIDFHTSCALCTLNINLGQEFSRLRSSSFEILLYCMHVDSHQISMVFVKSVTVMSEHCRCSSLAKFVKSNLPYQGAKEARLPLH